MAYVCPKDWFELSPTNKSGIKHCNTCNQNVYLCKTQEEINEQLIRGVCIAIFKPHMVLGLPSGQIPKRFFENRKA